MTPQEYISRFCNNAKKPRLKETPELYTQFQRFAEYILGNDFDERIMVLDCYTTDVYPRHISLADYNFIAWDSHFWDIYGRFLFMYYTYINVGSLMPRTFFVNYYKSMMLIYLANRFENAAFFSRYIAEEYSKLDMKFPPYSEYEDINDILLKIGHLQAFNVSRVFGFCHEVAHIAYEKKNEIASAILRDVNSYCSIVQDVIDLKKNIDPDDLDSDDEQMLDIVHIIQTNSTLLEEVCCDIIALLVLAHYFKDDCKMSQKEISDTLSTVHYFLVCTSWLQSTEAFWKGLLEVYTNIENDDAFVNPDNPYYKLGKKITDENAVRTSFVFNFCREKIGIDDEWIVKNLYNSGFIRLIDDSRGFDIIEGVLIKACNSKKDYLSSIKHQHIKNQLIGWENE